MTIEKLCGHILDCLERYQQDTGDSVRQVAKHAGVTQTFLNHIQKYRAINAGSHFALKKLAKFLSRKGVLRMSYQELFGDIT